MSAWQYWALEPWTSFRVELNWSDNAVAPAYYTVYRAPSVGGLPGTWTYVGRTVAALAADPDVLRLTGRWLVAAEVAAAYGVTDEHGHLPASNRPRILGEPVPPQL